MEKDKLIITIKLIFQHIENLPSLHDSCLLDALHESGHVAGLYSGRQIRNGIKVIMPWFKQENNFKTCQICNVSSFLESPRNLQGCNELS